MGADEDWLANHALSHIWPDLQFDVAGIETWRKNLNDRAQAASADRWISTTATKRARVEWTR